jgi:hypothetical protein
MNVANFELCQELYELSGWLTGIDGNCYVSLAGEKKGFEVRPLTDTGNDGIQICPAYDLGYLLRRLPVGNVLSSVEDKWIASSSPKVTTASTPEDAAAELAIELFKQGILKNDSEQTDDEKRQYGMEL